MKYVALKYQIPINAGTFISSDDVISHYKTQISHQISVKHLIIPSYLSKSHELTFSVPVHTKTLNDDLISDYKTQISHQISPQHLVIVSLY